MKNNKKGFTLIELLASMAIMSIILVIMITNVTTPANSVKENIKDSKIKTIIGNILKEAEKDINNKSTCTGNISSTNSLCTYDAKTYLQKIDSKDTSLTGKVYICYDNSKLKLSAEYSENDSYTCFAGPGSNKIIDVIGDAPSNTTNVITKESPAGSTCTNTLAYDGTSDNNLMYVGANPCNYVKFNNEIWRIVGIMNNVENNAGKKETRIKLIRNEEIGYYSWDSYNPKGVYNYGINDWTQSELMNELNGDYLNTNLKANTTWYIEETKSAVYNYKYGLKADAKKLIENAKWYLGGATFSQITKANNGTALNYYIYEHKKRVYGSISSETCDDGYCPRSLSWLGKVGLIYPSDYGFAVGGSVRNTCLNTILFDYNTNNCASNNWLVPKREFQWTITPYAMQPVNAVAVSFDGSVGNNGVQSINAVRPSVYLKSNVSITGGEGTKTNPYTLA